MQPEMSDAYHERAGILEFDLGIPRPYAEMLTRLYVLPRPSWLFDDQHQQMIADASALFDTHAKKLALSDWTPGEVWELIRLLAGRSVKAVGMADVTLGTGEKLYRRPSLTGEAKWQEGRRTA